MVYCPRCGKENPRGILYCIECNEFIGDEEEKKRLKGNTYGSIDTYPVSFLFEYTESSSRSELFIRVLYAFILSIVAEAWRFVAGLAQIFQFFHVLLYAKKHQSLFGFIEGYFRFYFWLTCYTLLLTDERPPITSREVEYPCKMTLYYEQSSKRLELLIRIFYGFLLSFIVSLWGMAVSIFVVIEWFYILFTKKKNFGLWEFAVRFMNFSMRVNAYILILTDERPPLTGD